jgi:SSS family solute:Na+ symporter
MGGLRAVAYNDVIQTIILVLGSALVTYFGLQALGGWGELRNIVGGEMFNLWKPLVPAGVEATWAPVRESTRMAWYFNDNYPWIGMLFCAPVIGLWYWCTDQYNVQRALGRLMRPRPGGVIYADFEIIAGVLFIIPHDFCLAKSGRWRIQQVLLTRGRLFATSVRRHSRYCANSAVGVRWCGGIISRS